MIRKSENRIILSEKLNTLYLSSRVKHQTGYGGEDRRRGSGTGGRSQEGRGAPPYGNEPLMVGSEGAVG